MQASTFAGAELGGEFWCCSPKCFLERPKSVLFFNLVKVTFSGLTEFITIVIKSNTSEYTENTEC